MGWHLSNFMYLLKEEGKVVLRQRTCMSKPSNRQLEKTNPAKIACNRQPRALTRDKMPESY